MTGGSATPVHGDNKTQVLKRLLESGTLLSEMVTALELSIGQLRHHLRRTPFRVSAAFPALAYEQCI